MTKKNALPLFEHLGIRLHRAYEAWLHAFVEEMNAAGHDWFTQGRATLIGHIPRTGCRQADLLARTAWTKQALQQMLDGLERQDVVRRHVDPNDKRGRLVELTDKGWAALADADRIKRDLSARFERKLGAEALEQMETLLDAMVADEERPE
ncbi:MAG: MarR family winged helix-turn-helix transcriptional regulator [Hyphomicrobiales bacterium]